MPGGPCSFRRSHRSGLNINRISLNSRFFCFYIRELSRRCDPDHLRQWPFRMAGTIPDRKGLQPPNRPLSWPRTVSLVFFLISNCCKPDFRLTGDSAGCRIPAADASVSRPAGIRCSALPVSAVSYPGQRGTFRESRESRSANGWICYTKLRA